MTADGPAYIARPAADIIVAPLDELTLIYHGTSGITHLTIEPVPQILAAMAEGSALSAADVHDRLSEQFDLGERDAAVVEISMHLNELAALGLVDQA